MRKFILPLLAIVFATAAAFASTTFQRAYYNTGVNSASEGDISTPPTISGITCGASGSQVCQVGVDDAYMNQSDAELANQSNLFKYTPAP